MRKKGYTYERIAFELGCNHGTAWRYVQQALKRLMAEINESAAEVRRLELERLDTYLEKLAPGIENGDVKAITTALRVGERRSRLLGLDLQPRQVEPGPQYTVEAARAIEAAIGPDWPGDFPRLEQSPTPASENGFDGGDDE